MCLDERVCKKKKEYWIVYCWNHSALQFCVESACPPMYLESMALCSRSSFVESFSSHAPTWALKSPPTAWVCVCFSAFCWCVCGAWMKLVARVRQHVPWE